MRTSSQSVLQFVLWTTLILVAADMITKNARANGFRATSTTPRRRHRPWLLAAAAKGFGAAPNKKPGNNKKQILKQLEKTYGGTTPQEIARGTKRRIDAVLSSQPPHMQLAIQIYQQLQQWNYRLSQMSVLQQTKIPVEEMEGAKRALAELERLKTEHDFTERDLHNLLQQATWDASADAKAARSITGEMPADIQKRVQAACDIAVQRAKQQQQQQNGEAIHVLDVGCGYGVLVPFLNKAGLQDHQIHGIDLSPEMIRNAKELHPSCHFDAHDFYSYQPKQTFDALLFCSSLHDMPDMMTATLPKARDLLRENGVLVIVHPQGASHVQNQVQSNPTMVPRGLPTTQELQALPGFQLIQAPAASKSREENLYGYLAVLERTESKDNTASN